jgi:ATP-binding cassette subfamily B protein
MKDKNKKFPTRTSMVLYFLKGAKRYFALSILFAFIVALLDMINPKIIQYTVDHFIGDAKGKLPAILTDTFPALAEKDYVREHLYLVALAVIIVAIAGAVSRYLSRYFNARGSETLIKRTRDKLFTHIDHLPFEWHSENHTGDIIQRCTSDVEMVKQFLSVQLTSLVRVVILVVLAVYFMIGINVRMTVVAAAFFPVVIGYSFVFHSKIGKAFLKADTEEGKLSAIAQENLTGVRVVRAFGREKYERERFEKQNVKYTRLWTRLMKLLAAFWATGDVITGAQVLTVMVLCTISAVNGEISVGQFIAFMSYNSMLVWPIRMVGRIIAELSKAGVSIDRISYIMNSEEEKDAPDAVDVSMDQDIEFSHVSFSYKNLEKNIEASAKNSKTSDASAKSTDVSAVQSSSSDVSDDDDTPGVLHDVSFKIKAHSTLGILGSTGSGKSTLMYLLDRLYALPEENGEITIGGVNIQNIKMETLRKNIGLVLQEPYLFSRTLSENIGIAKDAADMREIRDAARIAALDDSVMEFSKGYDTYVGERGVTLSGGQKQRAAIAQMLVTEPPIMVFDDSLSAVDTETDARIRAALNRMDNESTVILIAHRITTLMHADNIIVMDKGRIVEEGTHDDLLAKNGMYKKIYDIQTQGKED